ncbi:MAG: flagellar biosynthetic protein FliO, partial [Rhizobiaceae bacterium]
MKTIFSDTLSPTQSYILLFAAVILGVLLLLWLARKLLGGTFVSGGRSRHMRLAVMDAAPVDSRRRLVLVRRDDVEHLILIGGPTDLVIEQNIRLDGPAKAKPASIAPSAPAMTREAEPAARPAEPPRMPEPQRQPEPARPMPMPAPMPAPVVRQPAAPLPPVMQPRPAPQPAPNIAPPQPR